MIMPLLPLCAALLLAPFHGHGQSSTREASLMDAYWDAFGRMPDDAEKKHWIGRTDWKDKSALVEMHRQWIRSNAKAQNEVVSFSYWHVFGRLPTDGEKNFWLPLVKKGLTCAEVSAQHREHIIKTAPSELRANKQLLASLKKQGLELDTKGNIARGGAIVVPVGSYLIGNDGGSMVAAGGGNMVAAGGGNMVAAGGGNVLPSGAGGLVGNAGNTMRGFALMSVDGKQTSVEAGTVLLDKAGKGRLATKK